MMRAPDTAAVYPQHPGQLAMIAEDPADLGTAFGLDASLSPVIENDRPVGDEGPLDWLARRAAPPSR
jgi:hypothetical protein